MSSLSFSLGKSSNSMSNLKGASATGLKRKQNFEMREAMAEAAVQALGSRRQHRPLRCEGCPARPGPPAGSDPAWRWGVARCCGGGEGAAGCPVSTAKAPMLQHARLVKHTIAPLLFYHSKAQSLKEDEIVANSHIDIKQNEPCFI